MRYQTNTLLKSVGKREVNFWIIVPLKIFLSKESPEYGHHINTEKFLWPVVDRINYASSISENTGDVFFAMNFIIQEI